MNLHELQRQNPRYELQRTAYRIISHHNIEHCIQESDIAAGLNCK